MENKIDMYVYFKRQYTKNIHRHLLTPQDWAQNNLLGLSYVMLLVPHSGLYSGVTGQVLKHDRTVSES